MTFSESPFFNWLLGLFTFFDINGVQIKLLFFFSHQVIYCGQACQKMHWFTHKKVCKKLQEQREKQEAEAAKLRMQQNKGIFFIRKLK